MAIINDTFNRFTQLTGTADADEFRFLVDGNPDAILGYQDNSDRIDLSEFTGLTFADLAIRDGRNGKVIIEFTNANGAAEKITLKNNDAGFSASDLTETDFIFPADVVAGTPPTPANTITDLARPFDQLVGTAAQDAFVFTKDGNNDAILGFEDGLDLIDLSAIAGLTFADLSIRQGRNDKVIIEYANGDTDANGLAVIEKITMKNSSQGFIDIDLTADDFIFA